MPSISRVKSSVPLGQVELGIGSCSASSLSVVGSFCTMTMLLSRKVGSCLSDRYVSSLLLDIADATDAVGAKRILNLKVCPVLS